MGLLDDAIREHLELKRRRGADPGEIADQERDAFGAIRRGPEPLDAGEAEGDAGAAAEGGGGAVSASALAEEQAAAAEDDVDWEDVPRAGDAEPEDEADEDVLEETPEFLSETPEHDRLWFEQKPPRDFDFDDR